MHPTNILRHEHQHPMADQALSEEDQIALAADFERVERDEIGEGVHERYAAVARELAGG